MRGLSVALAYVGFVLAGCTTVEGTPPEAAEAPFNVPPADQASFDFAAEARVLTRACVASELGGPAQLQQLLGQGYVVTSQYGDVSYARQAPGPGELFAGGPAMIAASDPNSRLSCSIRVQPYTRTEALLPIVEDEMGRLGYRRIEVPSPSGRVATRYVGEGQRFSISGRTTTSPGLSYGLIEISRSDAGGDTTCRTQGLAPELREGCEAG